MSTTTSLSLVKGQRLDITKNNPHLTVVKFGLGWDANTGNGDDFDLDASALLLENGKLRSIPESVIYFNNLTNHGVTHSGDERTGSHAGDDETITINLSTLTASIDEVLFVVNIFEAAARHQNFGMVNNAFIRAYDGTTNEEFLRYDLTEDRSSDSGFIMGRLYKKEGEWKFQAVGTTVNGDLNAIIAPYLM